MTGSEDRIQARHGASLSHIRHDHFSALAGNHMRIIVKVDRGWLREDGRRRTMEASRMDRAPVWLFGSGLEKQFT